MPGGGLFLFPTIFADMIKRLPPPTCFNGPFVAIDEFLNKFKNLTLPEGLFFFYSLFTCLLYFEMHMHYQNVYAYISSVIMYITLEIIK